LEDYFPRKAGDPGSKQPFSLSEKRKDEVLRKKLLCNFFALMEKKEANSMAFFLIYSLSAKSL